VNAADAVLLLAHDNEAERDRALVVLAGDKRAAVGALVAALSRPSSSAHFARIVLLLAAFGARDAVGALLELLERGTLGFDDRAVVARALGELVDERHRGDARLRRQAVALSRDLMAPTRASIVPALARVGDAACVDELRRLAVADADAEVKRLAAAALASLPSSVVAPVAPAVVTPVAPAVVTPVVSSSAPTARVAPAPASTTAAALPPGAVAIDFAAMLASTSSTSPTATTSPATTAPRGPTTTVPEGGMVFDIEAMVKAQQSSPSSPPPPPPLSPDEQRIARLRDPRWTERARAIDDVVARGREIVPLLVERLGADAAARMGICLALARLQAPEAVSALLLLATGEARTGDERDVQAVALKALANCLTGSEQGISAPLLPLLKSSDPFVRAGAVLCLGRLADRVGPRAATLLLATDADVDVKKAAAVALAESVREEDVDLVPAWLGALQAIPRPPVEGQEALLVALARVDIAAGPQNAPWRVRARHRVRPLVFGATSSLRRLAVTVLDRCYAEDDPPPPWVVEDVFSRLGDASADVRVVAAAFVARFLEPGFTGAVARLEDALEKDERTVSLLCLEALRRHGTQLAKDALAAAAASDPDVDVRARAASLLTGFAPTHAEWKPTAALPPSSSASSSSSGATDVQPPSSPSTSRRVRPAGTGSGDVVEARDAPAGKP
jgi:HEAT repeat protein